MTEAGAQGIAKVLGGDVWDSGGGIWLVVVERSDGHVVAISDEVVCEYSNQEALQAGKPLHSIVLV